MAHWSLELQGRLRRGNELPVDLGTTGFVIDLSSSKLSLVPMALVPVLVAGVE